MPLPDELPLLNNPAPDAAAAAVPRRRSRAVPRFALGAGLPAVIFLVINPPQVPLAGIFSAAYFCIMSALLLWLSLVVRRWMTGKIPVERSAVLTFLCGAATVLVPAGARYALSSNLKQEVMLAGWLACIALTAIAAFRGTARPA